MNSPAINGASPTRPGACPGKRAWGFILLLLLSFPVFGARLPGAPARFQEEVTVTAIEIPVRVLHRGKAVKGLTQENFRIFENGVEQEISHFEVISRKIAGPGGIGEPAEAQEHRPKNRLFLLIFNIFDYDDSVSRAVDAFFEDIFRPGDQIAILTEGQVLDVERGKGVKELVARLKEAMIAFKAISTRTTVKNFFEVNREAERLFALLRGEGRESSMAMDRALTRFFENYQRVWEAYRNQFLVPDLAFYKNLIKRLSMEEGEKWAVCFQQRELFPQIKSASRLDVEIRNWVDSQVDPQAQVSARLIQARQQELQRSFNFQGNLAVDGLSDLFLGADFTFHLILMKSSRSLLSQDIELREVGEDYEELLGRISRLTGGSAAFSNEPRSALLEAAQVEDYHYLLVYTPKDSASTKTRRLEVKVDRPDVDVISLKQVLEAGPPPIAVVDFRSEGKRIHFALVHYQMTERAGQRRGIAEVKVTLYDRASNKAFEEGRVLDLFKKETRISLGFDWLKPGAYFVVIQAFDHVARQSHVYSTLVRF